MAEKIRHIVRIQNTDLDGNKSIALALTKIKGIGKMYSSAVLNIAKIDKDAKTGLLSNDQVSLLEDIIGNPSKYEIPGWMQNTRNDVFDGITKHLLGGKLKFKIENDVRRLMKAKSYRGLRHAWGLPLRGQRTKSNFRRNKGKAVGVKKKSGKSGRV